MIRDEIIANIEKHKRSGNKIALRKCAKALAKLDSRCAMKENDSFCSGKNNPQFGKWTNDDEDLSN